MKKYISILIFTIIHIALYAQNLSVSSFKALPSDLDARVNAKLKDQNGNDCAIIKVVTTQTGFVFDGGNLGITKTVNKTGEIWVYVPGKSKKITISHPQLGIMRDYLYPEPIETATCYELVLVSGNIKTKVEQSINSQYLFITAEPADAIITVTDMATNEEYQESGEFQKSLKPGKYSFRVEAPMYHTQAGIVELKLETKSDQKVVLKPNHGFLQISSIPEDGASITIDGIPTDLKTPCTTAKLKSGVHDVLVKKDMYKLWKQKVTVTDELTTPVKVELQPTFAEVVINLPDDAELYINDKWQSKGKWSGRLNAGIYKIEARKDKHTPDKKDIELLAGFKNNNFTLAPEPIYGALDILTKPGGANILIDGKKIGTSPSLLQKMLIGEYTITIEKDGWLPISKKISITENITTQISETLKNGINISIGTTPNGANCWINGESKGKTPIKTGITLGENKIRFEKETYTPFEKSINITPDNTNLTFKLEPDEIAQLRKGMKRQKALMYSSWTMCAGSLFASYVFKTKADNYFADYKNATQNATSIYEKARLNEGLRVGTLAAGSVFAVVGLYSTINVAVKNSKIKAYGFALPNGGAGLYISCKF